MGVSSVPFSELAFVVLRSLFAPMSQISKGLLQRGDDNPLHPIIFNHLSSTAIIELNRLPSKCKGISKRKGTGETPPR